MRTIGRLILAIGAMTLMIPAAAAFFAAARMFSDKAEGGGEYVFVAIIIGSVLAIVPLLISLALMAEDHLFHMRRSMTKLEQALKHRDRR